MSSVAVRNLPDATHRALIGFADGAIAAIATASGLALATRNTRDFAGTRVDLIDPWEAVRQR